MSKGEKHFQTREKGHDMNKPTGGKPLTHLVRIGLVLIMAGMTLAPVFAQEEGTALFTEKWQQWTQLYQEGKYHDAIALLEELLPIVRHQPDMNRELIGIEYNLACCYSLVGDTTKALTHLEHAIKQGYADYAHLMEDSDLEALRSTEKFKLLLAEAKAWSTFWDNKFIGTDYRENISEDEKIAGLSKLWAEIKSNFVFFDRLPNLNWDSLYMAYLPKVKQTKSTLAYYRLLKEMCAHLHDAHTSVIPPPELYEELWANLPIGTIYIDGKVYVRKVNDTALIQKGIVPGVEITHVNGLPVTLYVQDSIMPFLTASTAQAKRYNAYSIFLFSGSLRSPVVLTLQDTQGKNFDVTLKRREWSSLHRREKDVIFRIVEGNIAYVALNTFGNNEVARTFDSLFEQIRTADALILDVRKNGGGNSGVGWKILEYLTDTSFACLQCRSRVYTAQRRLNGLRDKWHVEDWTHPADGSNYFQGPVVVLIGPATGSAAEDFVVAFDVMNCGVLIGEPTAGSTGQPLLFSLPGGIRGRVCTKRCTYPDGTEFVGIGIQPDIPAAPTVDDLRSGTDAALTKAIDYLKGQIRQPDEYKGKSK